MTENITTVRESLSWAIKKLQDIRDEVTEKDPDRFTVQVKESRNIKPVREISHQDILGFKQTSGDILTIIVKDNEHKGKILGEKNEKT